MSSEPPPGEPYKPGPLQLDLPPVRPVAPGVPIRSTRQRPAARDVPVGKLVVAAAAIAVAGLLAFQLGLPWYVRTQFIEEARAHGITVTVEEVRAELQRYRLTGVDASAQDLAGVHLIAPEVEIETSWLQPRRIAVRGVELTIDGRWDAIGAAFDKWRATNRSFLGSRWAALAPIVADGSRIVWRGPVGDNGKVEASGVHVDLWWQDRGALWHASSGNVIVTLPEGTLGPWRVDVDRAPTSSRTCVAFDPGVPDMCTVLVVGDQDLTTAVDVNLPRSPVARLGLPLLLAGLKGKDLQIDATLHYATRGPARADASAKGGIYGIEAPGLLRTLDVAWDGSLTGDPRAGMDVKQARLAVGPLVGGVRGTLRRFDDGFRVDLAWEAGPVPCAAFDAPLALGQPFDIAYQLRKLAESAGLTKRVGDVSARGSLSFDSRDLGAAVVGFTPESRCSFFGK